MATSSSTAYVSCKTICVECVHHSGSDASKNYWNHLCCHPNFERIAEQDPVTGNIGFVGKNDLGGTYFTQDRFPHCREINNGNCDYFESK